MLKLAKPYIPEDAIQMVADVLRSGNLIQGRYVREFEEEIQHYLGIKHAVSVSSGTAALHLALVALGIKRGDEVIIPAFTYPATANVVEIVGAKPVIVDISLKDFCIDPQAMAGAVTSKTKVLMPVHEFGQAADMRPVIALARKHGLSVIEDAACAFGTEYNGKKAGTLGRIGCFSFHPRKAITTGEGGAVVTDDSVLAEKIRSLRNHGSVINLNKIDFKYAGLNYRMTEFQAVLGLSQLRHIEELIRRRMDLADLYDDVLSKIDGIRIPEHIKRRRMVYQTYHILLDERYDRDRVIEMLKTGGVETNLGAYAIPLIEYYKRKYRTKAEDYPNASFAMRQGLALPLGHHIRPEDIPIIAARIKEALRGS